MVIVDEGRRNLAKCLRGTNARQVIVDELADMQTTVLDLTETTRTVHGEEVRGDYTSLTHCPYCGAEVER